MFRFYWTITKKWSTQKVSISKRYETKYVPNHKHVVQFTEAGNLLRFELFKQLQYRRYVNREREQDKFKEEKVKNIFEVSKCIWV